MTSNARLADPENLQELHWTETVLPKKSNVTTSKIHLKKNTTGRQQSEWPVQWNDSLQKNILCFRFESLKAIALVWMSIHNPQDAPIQTQISCTLSMRIQQKNRFKSAETLFKISQNIVLNQPKYSLILTAVKI